MIFLPANYGALVVPELVAAAGPGTADLVSWWSLDETSGARADSHGSNNLADTNTVLYDTGKQGNAAYFERANNESLELSTGTPLGFGDEDFSVGAWVKADTLNDGMGIIFKSRLGTDVAYLLMYNNADNRFRWYVQSGATNHFVDADTFGAPATATWYFVVGVHDSVNDVIKISVNGGAFDSEATTEGSVANSEPFVIGDWGSKEWDGLIDEAFVFGKALSADDITWLYNSGAGRQYSDL